MEKQIIYTITRGYNGITLKTKSNFIENCDNNTTIPSMILFSTMEKLTAKYNNKGIAVLFEVE